MRFRTLIKPIVLVTALLAVFGVGWLSGHLGLGATIDTASLPAVERAFAERMRNATLVGTFSVAGRDAQAPSEDRYEIASVEKVGPDLWRFSAKMSCCGPVTLPVVVPMRFVGDTPVIMMTDHSLPGIGTFSVRLFFYGDRYAGTWQHGQTGGLMSGRIEPAAAAR
jgi:hypothetical protein